MMESDYVQFRIAEVDEILDLRWRLLRVGLPRDAAHFEGDDAPTTHHFAAVLGDRVVACVTYRRGTLDDKPTWQLRGMAVDDTIQKSGVGSKLIAFADSFVASQDYSDVVWCNARVPAIGFYQRLGWTVIGEQFDVLHAGPHVKMVKRMGATVR
jgi:predicted GNAT family N-acyltransferase